MGIRTAIPATAFFAATASLLYLAACAKEGGGAAEGQKKGGKKGDLVATVAVAKVTSRDVPTDVEIIGNVEAFSNVAVKARVTGPVEKVWFNDGDFVRRGQKLFTIDQAPFQNGLNQALAIVEREKAGLAQAKANLQRDMAQHRFLTSQATRFANLQREGVISKEQAEQYQSSADVVAQSIVADQASIASAEAAIQAAEATVKQQRIQLGYTEVYSPVDGRTGNIPMKEGNLATANVTELIAISQVQPVYVAFALPEAQLNTVKDAMARGRLVVRAAPPDDPANPESGQLTYFDSSVDPTTGTIKLRATFQNARRMLWPGQFVRVTLRLGMRVGALLVPNQAVQTGQDGSFIYRVTEGQTVEVAKVNVSGRVNEEMVISDGVSLGDTVVTEGQLRLAPGMRIRLRGEGGEGKGGGKKGGKKKAEPKE